MDTVVTVIQVLLTLFLTVAGVGKLVVPYARLAGIQSWVNDFKPGIIRLISVLEVCAAVGIFVPLFWRSLTPLAPVAAVGTALLMAGAMATHLRRGEYLNMAGNLLWLGLALFVAYGKLVGFAA